MLSTSSWILKRTRQCINLRSTWRQGTSLLPLLYSNSAESCNEKNIRLIVKWESNKLARVRSVDSQLISIHGQSFFRWWNMCLMRFFLSRTCLSELKLMLRLAPIWTGDYEKHFYLSKWRCARTQTDEDKQSNYDDSCPLIWSTHICDDDEDDDDEDTSMVFK
jgi:hypothetical protein